MGTAMPKSFESERQGSFDAPLLPTEEKLTEHADDRASKSTRKSVTRLYWHVFIHLLLFTLYTSALYVASGWFSNQHCHEPLVYSPAQEAISYHKVNFNSDLFYSSRFRGPPRPELDATWHDLLENSNIRLSSEELRRLGKSSVALADGSGYYGALNVHHHLHCLKSVRQYAHQEYYNITNADKEEHLDHCLDDIRQALMCHADISVFTYDWIPSYRKPLPNFKVAHECVDWELLGNWTRERSFSLYDQKSLIHPDLGVSFPKANGPVEANAWNLDRRLIFPDKVH